MGLKAEVEVGKSLVRQKNQYAQRHQVRGENSEFWKSSCLNYWILIYIFFLGGPLEYVIKGKIKGDLFCYIMYHGFIHEAKQQQHRAIFFSDLKST